MRSLWISLIFLAGIMTGAAQQLPDGPGKSELEKKCTQCHELSRSISLRQDRDGWSQTMSKMAAFGMKSSDEENALVLSYLTVHFPPEDLPPVNVNKAPAIELEARLSLRRSQAAALISYRKTHGAFKSLEDLRKVPLLDFDLVESKKDRIVF
jgi:competence ComEA-like helix-hairpin-helix protein